MKAKPILKNSVALFALMGGLTAAGKSFAQEKEQQLVMVKVVPAEREKGGVYIRAHGLALFNVPSSDKLGKLGALSTLSLTNDLTGDIYSLNRKIGYGGGLRVGYDFGTFFIGGGFDYARQDFTTNNSQLSTATDPQRGTINNYMAVAGFGARVGNNFGFTFGADYAMNFIKISGLANESNDAKLGRGVDRFLHDSDKDSAVAFLQHNIIGTLQLDYTTDSSISVGAFGKYYYAFATKKEGYGLSANHSLAAGAFLGFTF